MKIYSSQGFNDFVICLGYKGYHIKEYFANYFLHQSDIKIDLAMNAVEVLNSNAEPWKVSLIDTGIETQTAGRLRRIRQYLNDETFMFTYGDGLSDVDLHELLKTHQQQKRLVTVTAVQPAGRFGALKLSEGNLVTDFLEKPKGDGGWINGGFFVAEPRALDYVHDDLMPWEKAPMENIAADRQLSAYLHQGFWKPMDTLRDKNELEEMWKSGQAPWKIWN
jgi:glucose-1-phosphate cytidylyltransferase